MFFLLRAAFWISVVALILPTSHDPRPATRQPAVAAIGSSEAIAASGEAIATRAALKAAAFCAKRPETCASSVSASDTIGGRIENGAKLFSFLLGGTSDPVVTGSVASKPKKKPLSSK